VAQDRIGYHYHVVILSKAGASDKWQEELQIRMAIHEGRQGDLAGDRKRVTIFANFGWAEKNSDDIMSDA
jgi:hypothetical protein